MAFYDSFMSLTQSPKTVWKEQLQELVNQEFENTSTVQYDVEEEITFGTLKFKNIECRINSLVDAKTGQRVNDDYKKIIFKDLNKLPELGTRYRFNNNIWMVFSTDNIKTDTSSAYLRRCNNVMGMQDKYGKIHYEPCCIDYKITETQLFKEYTLDVPSGRIQVNCQVNDFTKDIYIGQRFIFGNQVYRVREHNSFDRQETFNKNSSFTLSFYADIDNKKNTDNFELSIADYCPTTYRIEADDIIKSSLNQSGQIHYKIFKEDEVTNEEAYFESDNPNIVSVDTYNGQYICHQNGECNISCIMYNNPDVIYNIHVIVDENNSKEIRVYPDIKYIGINQSITYTIDSYINGERLYHPIVIEVSGVPKSCYNYIITENSITITNLRIFPDALLKIECLDTIDQLEKVFYVELGGMWF